MDDRSHRYGCTLDHIMMPDGIFCWTCRQSWNKNGAWPDCPVAKAPVHTIPRYPQRRLSPLWAYAVALLLWAAIAITAAKIVNHVWPIVPPAL